MRLSAFLVTRKREHTMTSLAPRAMLATSLAVLLPGPPFEDLMKDFGGFGLGFDFLDNIFGDFLKGRGASL